MIDADLAERISRACAAATATLLARAEPEGYWRGRLSSSALATAVAGLAWKMVGGARQEAALARALTWLADNANADGGWGDSPQSPSNFSTTLLVWALLSSCAECGYDSTRGVAGRWLAGFAGSLEPESLARAVLRAYGTDRTFSAPILTHCALAGVLGREPWRYVPQLPFELAALPHRLFSFLHLPVVSYALPALIAIGLVRHRRHGGRRGLRHVLRERVCARVLAKLAAMQPQSGGFLEAAPLTGFVVMALAAGGERAHPAVCRGLDFLHASQRADGSLPVDSDLAVWLTTHSARALPEQALPPDRKSALHEWILARQFMYEHPFTHARPGGWAWTDLPGGVPDADDTAGALLALHRLSPDAAALPESPTSSAVHAGIVWLLGLQNRDGGFPAFCRGWGRLPFDRSCPDITAHALQALAAWRGVCASSGADIRRALAQGLGFLRRAQRTDGAWLPLWFGNQSAPQMANPVFGTAQVCLALAALRGDNFHAAQLYERGLAFLRTQQNQDGGWGGAFGAPSSVEETALALCALAAAGGLPGVSAGARWLLRATEDGTVFPPAPIGLYFSALWYSEELYPRIFSLKAFVALKGAADSAGSEA